MRSRRRSPMAFKAISGNKVRAFLTMLGVIIGVMSVIVLIAIGQGTTASVTESISSMGTNLLTVSIQTRRVGMGMPGRIRRIWRRQFLQGHGHFETRRHSRAGG